MKMSPIFNKLILHNIRQVLFLLMVIIPKLYVSYIFLNIIYHFVLSDGFDLSWFHL